MVDNANANYLAGHLLPLALIGLLPVPQRPSQQSLPRSHEVRLSVSKKANIWTRDPVRYDHLPVVRLYHLVYPKQPLGGEHHQIVSVLKKHHVQYLSVTVYPASLLSRFEVPNGDEIFAICARSHRCVIIQRLDTCDLFSMDITDISDADE